MNDFRNLTKVKCVLCSNGLKNTNYNHWDL